MPDLITCTNINLHIDGHHLLRDISFSVQHGQHLALMGANGAGKTLLLTILSGNLQPSSGEAYILGEDLSGKNSAETKKQIGFVSQKLFSDYDVHSPVLNVVMSGLFGSIGICQDPTKANNKVAKEYITRVISQKYHGRERAIELLKQLHASHVQDETFGQLSQGEKTKVLLARALINEPTLLILDEPTTGLDLKARIQFSQMLTSLAHKTTIIYVTHHLEEITDIFPKVLLLKSGAVFRCGNTSELMTGEVFSELLDTHVEIHEQKGRYCVSF